MVPWYHLFLTSLIIIALDFLSVFVFLCGIVYMSDWMSVHRAAGRWGGASSGEEEEGGIVNVHCIERNERFCCFPVKETRSQRNTGGQNVCMHWVNTFCSHPMLASLQVTSTDYINWPSISLLVSLQKQRCIISRRPQRQFQCAIVQPEEHEEEVTPPPRPPLPVLRPWSLGLVVAGHSLYRQNICSLYLLLRPPPALPPVYLGEGEVRGCVRSVAQELGGGGLW
jgi:hypothetical protein